MCYVEQQYFAFLMSANTMGAILEPGMQEQGRDRLDVSPGGESIYPNAIWGGRQRRDSASGKRMWARCGRMRSGMQPGELLMC
jgi:hypothetical protein